MNAESLFPDSPAYRCSMVVARNLLNRDDQPMFTYTYIDDDLGRSTSTSPPTTDTIVAVRVRVIVDMQPGHAPEPMDLTTVVQLRNQQ